MHSATAISVTLGGRESPSSEVDAGRPAHMRHHYRAPNRSAPCSTGMPPPSAAPATPPSGAESPQTTAAVVGDADMATAKRPSRAVIELVIGATTVRAVISSERHIRSYNGYEIVAARMP